MKIMTEGTKQTPNPEQQELIENTEGIYLVDAGAGTGKTFTLTRRYANILSSSHSDPSDILLITFTNNAADEMKERVINHCDYDAIDLQEAPISTFHSMCQRILRRDGFNAPKRLGLDRRITPEMELLENKVVESSYFRQFWYSFTDSNPKYDDFYGLVRDPDAILELTKSLSAKGIFPTANGWYQEGEQYLEGDFDGFKKQFELLNEPVAGKSGPNQSELLKSVRRTFRRKTYPDSAPDRAELAGGESGKQLRPDLAGQSFAEDRTRLKNFVHDLYWEYVRYSLDQNYLTFNTLLMFAYVLLCEDEDVRKRNQYQYVMVDEFQDTSEIQFKLTLLLSATNNICVVGDWKQSIYSFQYASIKNIQNFRHRLEKYKKELNSDRDRVHFPVSKVTEIDLNRNYRSTQQLLDFSERSLLQPATKGERFDPEPIKDKIVHLQAENSDQDTGIEALESSEESTAVLELIQDIVGNEEYLLPGGDPPDYDDIAVFSRSRDFGLELQREAREYNIPVAYEGGVELFTTNPSIILLAWLRVLSDPLSIKGWAVILERAGYTLPEIKGMIPDLDQIEDLYDYDEEDLLLEGTVSINREHEEINLPHDVLDFRDRLAQLDRVTEVARLVFDRYGNEGGFSDKLIEVLYDVNQSPDMNRGELIRFIENNIETGTTYEVDTAGSAKSVTIQTIHSAKGLEYPIVILSDMNRHRFPGRSSHAPVIDYIDPYGLRQRKVHGPGPNSIHYDNWKMDVLSQTQTGQYDEERRLLYVALTRAERYLFLSANTERQGLFFEGLKSKCDRIRSPDQPEPQVVDTSDEQTSPLSIESIGTSSPVSISVHDLMDESVYEDVEDRRGKELGQHVHEFAERLIRGEEPGIEEPGIEDQRNIERFLAGREGERSAEIPCALPLEVGDRSVVIKGQIDALMVDDECVEIIDFKTDQQRVAEEEYRKQLSVYYHVVRECYAESTDIRAFVYYTCDDETVEYPILKRNEIQGLVENVISSRGEQ